MAVVHTTENPSQVLDDAGSFLATDPVRHNLILTLLQARVANPEAGRYWVVEIDGDVVGVAVQSPLHFFATVTPMPTQAARALVDHIVDGGVALPGVTGEAATAASFAGQWAERTRSGAHPHQGQRLYEVERVIAPRAAAGDIRSATGDDRDLLVVWLRAFQAETGDPGPDAPEYVDRRVRLGQLHIWDDAGGLPVAVAGVSAPAAGAVRVGPVYTPPEQRRHGYASTLVAALSDAARSVGQRCLLYTDLGNPTSNAIYVSIGYRPVSEILRYGFGGRR
jgi:predicted GNAT family acetyltransferase